MKSEIVNGWRLLFHPCLIEQLSVLNADVTELKKRDEATFKKKSKTKLLAAIYKLIYDKIPQDPTLAEYRQGDTLGGQNKHWFRAKFFQQYRLFFRFDTTAKLIIFVWVNDENTKRAYGSKKDAYLTFKRMLQKGSPPNSWVELLQESTS